MTLVSKQQENKRKIKHFYKQMEWNRLQDGDMKRVIRLSSR